MSVDGPVLTRQGVSEFIIDVEYIPTALIFQLDLRCTRDLRYPVNGEILRIPRHQYAPLGP